MKCIICSERPARGGGFCPQCGGKVKKTTREAKTVQPKHFLTYREIVVGLYPIKDGKLRAELLKRSHEKLPKGRTVNLNQFCTGYTRQTIKRFKACCLSLAHA